MYGMTRRDFLWRIEATGLVLLADYLPRFSQSTAIGQEQKDLYAFDAYIRFFYGIRKIKVEAELETRVNDFTYFSNFKVFSEGSKKIENDLVYAHYSKGMIENGILLPAKVNIQRNFSNLGAVEYLILWILGYDKIDEFNLDFEYIGEGIKVNLTEKRCKQPPIRDGWHLASIA